MGNLRNTAQTCRPLRMPATETRNSRNSVRSCRALRGVADGDEELGNTAKTLRVLKKQRGPGCLEEKLEEELEDAAEVWEPLLPLSQPGASTIVLCK